MKITYFHQEIVKLIFFKDMVSVSNKKLRNNNKAKSLKFCSTVHTQKIYMHFGGKEQCQASLAVYLKQMQQQYQYLVTCITNIK